MYVDHSAFMQQAVEESRAGILAGHGGPFGAVIIKDGQVIAKGHNMVVAKQDPTCHGEMEAIRAACSSLGTFDLTGCDIYTTGEPCPMCLGACLWANLEHIYYGCSSQDIERIGFRDKQFHAAAADKASLLTQVEREACLALFDEYQAIPDKTNY